MPAALAVSCGVRFSACGSGLGFCSAFSAGIGPISHALAALAVALAKNSLARPGFADWSPLVIEASAVFRRNLLS